MMDQKIVHEFSRLRVLSNRKSDPPSPSRTKKTIGLSINFIPEYSPDYAEEDPRFFAILVDSPDLLI